MTTTTTMLPAEFADLEPFSMWCIEHEPDRYDKRLASTMEELQAFYDAALPRAQAVMDHLDQFDLYDLPDPQQHLLWMMYSLIIVAFPVEAFRQPKVPDTGSTYLEKTIEPTI